MIKRWETIEPLIEKKRSAGGRRNTLPEKEYQTIPWLFRHGISKAKGQLKTHLATEMKGNKKVHQRQKYEKGKHGPAAKWSSKLSDKGCGKCWSIQSLLFLILLTRSVLNPPWSTCPKAKFWKGEDTTHCGERLDLSSWNDIVLF